MPKIFSISQKYETGTQIGNPFECSLGPRGGIKRKGQNRHVKKGLVIAKKNLKIFKISIIKTLQENQDYYFDKTKVIVKE